MAIQGIPGTKSRTFFGPNVWGNTGTINTNSVTLDAANEALIWVGRMETSDEGSHTIDTTGSSAIRIRTAAVTFANGGTTVKVGIAPVDTANGPPGRASHASDVIAFDVAGSFTGGGGGITATSSLNLVPTTGSKTIAHGDLVAIAIQMTARGGADSVVVQGLNTTQGHRPTATSFTGGSYAAANVIPNAFVTFADGATGWLQMSDIISTITTRTWNSGSATTEYGQLYNFPFPCKIYGAYGWADFDANCDIVLYSDPLGGSPVPERTVSIDSNTVKDANGNRWAEMFSSPYSLAANTDIGITYKPGASNVSTYLKTLGAAGNRAADVGGTSAYGISRASGAFGDANSSLDHYYIGLSVGAFEHGVWPSGHLGV